MLKESSHLLKSFLEDISTLFLKKTLSRVYRWHRIDLYQVRVITVFAFFRLLTDFVCLYTYEFWLSLWKIVRSSVILLLPLFTYDKCYVTVGVIDLFLLKCSDGVVFLLSLITRNLCYTCNSLNVVPSHHIIKFWDILEKKAFSFFFH